MPERRVEIAPSLRQPSIVDILVALSRIRETAPTYVRIASGLNGQLGATALQHVIQEIIQNRRGDSGRLMFHAWEEDAIVAASQWRRRTANLSLALLTVKWRSGRRGQSARLSAMVRKLEAAISRWSQIFLDWPVVRNMKRCHVLMLVWTASWVTGQDGVVARQLAGRAFRTGPDQYAYQHKVVEKHVQLQVLSAKPGYALRVHAQ